MKVRIPMVATVPAYVVIEHTENLTELELRVNQAVAELGLVLVADLNQVINCNIDYDKLLEV